MGATYGFIFVQVIEFVYSRYPFLIIAIAASCEALCDSEEPSWQCLHEVSSNS